MTSAGGRCQRRDGDLHDPERDDARGHVRHCQRHQRNRHRQLYLARWHERRRRTPSRPSTMGRSILARPPTRANRWRSRRQPRSTGTPQQPPSAATGTHPVTGWVARVPTAVSNVVIDLTSSGTVTHSTGANDAVKTLTTNGNTVLSIGKRLDRARCRQLDSQFRDDRHRGLTERGRQGLASRSRRGRRSPTTARSASPAATPSPWAPVAARRPRSSSPAP